MTDFGFLFLHVIIEKYRKVVESSVKLSFRCKLFFVSLHPLREGHNISLKAQCQSESSNSHE